MPSMTVSTRDLRRAIAVRVSVLSFLVYKLFVRLSLKFARELGSAVRDVEIHKVRIIQLSMLHVQSPSKS